MIADVIELVLSNLPLVFCVAAVLGAAVSRGPEPWPERYLSWLLLLAVGADGVWAGIFHIFFPGIASQKIGWQPSPFEFEIGVSDAAMGIVAIAAFWRGLGFKTAIASYAILFYAGVAIGHFVQAFGHGNFAPDNFGLLLALTLARVFALTWLLVLSHRARPGESTPRQ